MKNELNRETVRDVINACYGGLKGDDGLADRIIAGHQKEKVLWFPSVRRRYAMPVLIISLFLITATALALALMNKPASISTFGLWRYANGQLTYQGDGDKRPSVILEDENIRFIAADDAETGLYYITRQEGQTRLKNITQDGWTQTPGRTINSKYNIVDLQVSGDAYLLANTAQAQGQVFRLDLFGEETVKDAAIAADGWENRDISAFSVYGGTLYAYSAERNELAAIDLSSWRLLYKPVRAGSILSLTAGMEKDGDPWIIALTQSEGKEQKQLLLINARTGDQQDTGEPMPDWAEYVNRNRKDLYVLGSEGPQAKSFRISALSGKQAVHDLYIVNYPEVDSVMQAAIKLFHQRYPDVELIFRHIDDERVVTTELMAGEGGIDVFGNISNSFTPEGMMLKNGAILDLTDHPDIQKNWESWRDLRKLVSAEGRQFGVLVDLNLYAFVVSEQWAEKIGWSIPDGPWSMEEFETLVQKADTWNQTHEEHLYLLCDFREPYFMLQYEATHLNAFMGEADFETEEFQRILKLYKDMNDKGLLYFQENLTEREKLYDFILPDNTLLRVARGSLSWMNQAKKMILPPSPAGQEYPYVAEGWYLFANANSKYPEEAKYLLACYASEEAVSKNVYANYGQWLKDKTLYGPEDPNLVAVMGSINSDTERQFNEAIVRALPFRTLRELFWLKIELLPEFLQGNLTAEAFAAAMQQKADMVLGE